MTDYTELQKAGAYAAQDTIKFADEDEEMRALQQFHEEVDPETVLALIAENERLQAALHEAGDLAASSQAGPVQGESLRIIEKIAAVAAEHRDGRLAALERAVCAESELNQLGAFKKAFESGYAYEAIRAERDQLKAENEIFEAGMRSLASTLGAGGYNAEVLTATQLVEKVQWGVDHLAENSGRQIDELRAEVAGLRTGYEAYERVNAELKAELERLTTHIADGMDCKALAIQGMARLTAENEALRDDLEQNQYDANAWRNGEESVWIEVFNSEGDDPFISAISGQITVEQLALIQAEILEYREDYFEKGSGLYVFRCAHYQAHHDNVGMTEPAHWETDFESYSPFPWEEEAAAIGKGEQS